MNIFELYKYIYIYIFMIFQNVFEIRFNLQYPIITSLSKHLSSFSFLGISTYINTSFELYESTVEIVTNSNQLLQSFFRRAMVCRTESKNVSIFFTSTHYSQVRTDMTKYVDGLCEIHIARPSRAYFFSILQQS